MRTEFGIVVLVPGVDQGVAAIAPLYPKEIDGIRAALNQRRQDGPPGGGAPYDTWEDQFRIFPESVPAGMSEQDFMAALAREPGAHYRLIADDGNATEWRQIAPGFKSYSKAAAGLVWTPYLLAYATMSKLPEKDVGKGLARDVASLPPAMRTIFQKCGDPSADNLVTMIAELPDGERGTWTVTMAAYTLTGFIARQAALQWHRKRRQERERADLAGLLAFEEFPMPRRRPPA